MNGEVAIAGVMFVNSSRTYFVDAGKHQLAAGDKVLIQLDQETVVGEVVIAPNQVVASAVEGQLWPIVRTATSSDIEFFSQLGPSDETTVLLGGLGRDNTPLCYKTVTMDFVAATTWQQHEPDDQATCERGACDKATFQYTERGSTTSSYCAYPRLAQKVNTPEGAGVVKSISIFHEKITVELQDGVVVELSVTQCSKLANEQN